jgi:hypothetical protein
MFTPWDVLLVSAVVTMSLIAPAQQVLGDIVQRVRDVLPGLEVELVEEALPIDRASGNPPQYVSEWSRIPSIPQTACCIRPC